MVAWENIGRGFFTGEFLDSLRAVRQRLAELKCVFSLASLVDGFSPELIWDGFTIQPTSAPAQARFV
jgi:hypothetical protein